jgi:MerR family mercuric resistance operon transcriptional regulator
MSMRWTGCSYSRARRPDGHRVAQPTTVTVLRVIKAAQRLGFTLDEVAELLEVSRHPRRRSDAGLQARAQAKLAEIDRKLAELSLVRDTLRAAVDAGCDDLIECADSACCPLPFVELTTAPP